MSDGSLQKLIIWDWEGTIVDSRLLLWQTVNAGLMSLGMPTIDVDAWYAVFVQQRRLDALLHALIPNMEYQDYTYLLTLCEQKMLKPASPPLIPGMHDIFISLKNEGVLLAVASNKEPLSLRKNVQQMGLEGDFALCLGPGYYKPKPSPDMLEAIIDSLGATPGMTIMIGDSPADMEAARNAGIKALGLDYSNVHAAELMQSGASALVCSPKSLLSAITMHLISI